ncbi:MAG TPA: UTRA domain-containing protein [Clostridiaceae bacterium]|nr:UTRA domain-containing protein [Clostridiaceae bacterium]
MINKYSNVPLYCQLKNLIIEKIESGEYPRDSKIPSEQEFCELYDISRPTVRQAISELTNNGYLYKVKGKGTFVAAQKTSIDIRNYSGFTDSILDSAEPGKRNIVSINAIIPDSCRRLNEVFKSSPGYGNNVEIAEIKYVLTQDNQVLSLNVSYIPLGLFPNIIEDIKAGKPSHEILKGKYPLVPVRTKSKLEIVFTDQSDAQYLQVQTGLPLIKIENVLFSKNGQIVEFVVSKYRADKCQLLFENSK